MDNPSTMRGWRAKLQKRWANHATLPLSEAERRFLRAVAETLQRTLNAESVILFGSAARSEATPKSDIDLLIIASVSVDFYQQMAAARRALRLEPWLSVARHDWNRIHRNLSEEDYSAAGFFLQQSLEKYLKAFYPTGLAAAQD
ncbi:MAG: hypothetical protein KatS3mg016_1548 [Fimbriimonadales bacterium]|nr:MAG: hypothetical protein KatS3mg016_1548 [Fimbriimonadales bacterium]